MKGDGGATENLPPHIRCVNVCLLAYRMTREERYLELAKLHAGRWADAICARDELPIALTAEGARVGIEDEAEAAHLGIAGQASVPRSAVDRAENLLASAAPNTFLELWQITGEDRFRAAAEKLVDVLATQLGDPDAGPAADAIRAWRRSTGDGRFDQAVRDAAAQLSPLGFSELSIDPEVRREQRPPGIGKRSDMPAWFEDGEPRRHNPILLGLAAEVAGDERLATRAVDLARACFALARQVFPHGRRHGCSARSVSAIARGHGRNNNAGVVTAVLDPLLHTLGQGRRG